MARCCERAAAAGVRREMTLAHARALLPGGVVHVEPFDERRERRALKALAAWALRYAPIIAPDPPCGLFMDVGGCQRLFRGERRLVNLIANSMRWMGIGARIATAATYGCAWAVARYGTGDRVIVPAGAEHEALAPLPVEGLRLEETMCRALREVGIERAGDLLERPRLELVARFGPRLLQRLDQATGEAPEAIEPIRPRESFRAERIFDGPVTQMEAVAKTAEALCGMLAETLRRRERGASEIELTLERIDAEAVRVVVALSRPSRHAAHFRALLRPGVETAHLGFGVERVVLEATRTDRLRHEQVSRWREEAGGDGTALETAMGELVDALAGRLEARRAVRVEPVESYLPERAFTRHPVVEVPGALVPVAGPGAPASRPPSITPAERPSLLLEHPEPIEVMTLTPGGPPTYIRWRGAGRFVIARFGPERIGEEWWRAARHGGATARRDYFRLQDESGRWLWVYRESATGRWFVHGQWA